MPQQKLIWHGDPLSVYEWSKLDLGTMLHRRPNVRLVNDSGKPIADPLAKLRQLKGLLKSLS